LDVRRRSFGLPGAVVRDGKLVGLVTERVFLAFSPGRSSS
jgi:hypothetical protein